MLRKNILLCVISLLLALLPSCGSQLSGDSSGEAFDKPVIATMADFTYASDSFDESNFSGWKNITSSSNITKIFNNNQYGYSHSAIPASDLDDWIKLSSNRSFKFSPGDQILCLWFNSSNDTISYIDKYGNQINAFIPLISFTDSNKPVDVEGEPDWFSMRGVDYNWKDINGSYYAKKILSGESRYTLYTITSSQDAPGIRAATEGSHLSINIAPQIKQTGLMLQKIIYINKKAAGPEAPVNITANKVTGSEDCQIELTWAASSINTDLPVSYLYYRVYRNGKWIFTTDQTSFIDGGLEADKIYSYYIEPMNFRTAGTPSEVIDIKTSVFRSNFDLINPAVDLEYKGAFRLPEGQGWNWRYKQGDMAFYPSGDIANTDAYPGSLYVNKGQINNDGPMMTEISIPEPKIESHFEDLPSSTLLQEPTFYKRSGTYTPSLASKNGLVYLPSTDTFFYSVPYGYWVGDTLVSHGSFKPDFTEKHGLWHVEKSDGTRPLHYRAYTGYMGRIPDSFASTYLPGMNAVGGTSKPSYSGKGPMLYAFQFYKNASLLPDVDVPDGDLPDGKLPDGSDASIIAMPFKTLIEYDQTNTTGSKMAYGWLEDDNWNGVEWIEFNGKKAIVFSGVKSFGEYYYGFRDSRDGTCNSEASHIIPQIEYVEEYKEGGKGPRARRYETMLLFYNPDDVAKVINGTMGASDIQPYAGLPLDKYLLAEYRDTVPVFIDRINTITWDSQNGIIYIGEKIVSRLDSSVNYDIVHVFKIKQ